MINQSAHRKVTDSLTELVREGYNPRTASFSPNSVFNPLFSRSLSTYHASGCSPSFAITSALISVIILVFKYQKVPSK